MRTKTLPLPSSLFSSLLLFSALHFSSATPTHFSSALKTCTTYKSIPLTVTSSNLIFDPAQKFQNNLDVTDFVTNLSSRSAAETFHPFVGQRNETATYQLAGTFCTPVEKKEGREKTVLILTHGLNFNRGYWDPKIEPEKYSFVDAAIREGYSVFFYDRLGVGKSQKLSGYVNQLPIQVALASSLTKNIRAGKFTGALGKPDKIVLVGHSYGSAISAAVLTAEPDLAEGVVLTGFSYSGQNLGGFILASQLKIAAKQSPSRWRALDTGYLTPVDIYSNVNTFFKKPYYTLPVVKYADANKEPIAITEFLTSGVVPAEPRNYTGAALIIPGKYDFIFCSSDCDGVIETPATEIFSNAKAFKAVSFPGAAHGLNFATAAPGAFAEILGYIKTNV